VIDGLNYIFYNNIKNFRRCHINPNKNKAVDVLGFWSALIAAISSIGYSVAAILSLLKLLPDPMDKILQFAPSLVLALAFVVMMVCIHYSTPLEKRVWSLTGLVFAIIYTVFVSTAYVTWLMVVAPHALSGNLNEVSPFMWDSGSYLMWIDGFGYTLMSVSTLFAFPVFSSNKLEKWIRVFFIFNGCLAPFIFLAGIYPVFLIMGALWMITIPVSTILVCVFFRRNSQYDY
jgi:hypothetical protein